MKSITIYFDNEDFIILEKSKIESGLGWRDFFLSLAMKYNNDKKNEKETTKKEVKKNE